MSKKKKNNKRSVAKFLGVSRKEWGGKVSVKIYILHFMYLLAELGHVFSLSLLGLHLSQLSMLEH